MIYILDSNALMEPNRTYYAFDLAPSFWEWLSSSSLEGRVASIDRVKDEVSAGKGDLVEWVNGLRESFWLPETAESVASATEIARWANNPDRIYRREAIDEFMGSADLQIIAHAKAVAGVVVTRETSDPNSRKRVKIPDVCKAFSVAWTSPTDAYRQLGLRLC